MVHTSEINLIPLKIIIFFSDNICFRNTCQLISLVHISQITSKNIANSPFIINEVCQEDNLGGGLFQQSCRFSVYSYIKMGLHHRVSPVNFPKICSSFSTEHLQISCFGWSLHINRNEYGDASKVQFNKLFFYLFSMTNSSSTTFQVFFIFSLYPLYSLYPFYLLCQNVILLNSTSFCTQT